MATENAPTQINRVTTEQKVFIPATPSLDVDLLETNGELHTSSLSPSTQASTRRIWTEYAPQTLRFHIMHFMPGQVEVCDDGTSPPGSEVTCSPTCRASPGCREPASINGNYAKLILWDLRKKDEVLQWQLDDNGDGAVNSTMYEECDHVATPNPTLDSAYVYPTNTQATAAATQAAFPVSAQIFYDATNKVYKTCSTIGLAETITSLCGDGIPSNGPPVGGFADSQQDSGAETFEECDDGNTVAGDGCSADCTVELGYECPVWGAPCNLICGNGYVEAQADGTLIAIKTGTSLGVDVMETEECDLGLASAHSPSPDSLKGNTATGNALHACTDQCKITDKSKWRCTWVNTGETRVDKGVTTVKFSSQCTYLCGNQQVDIEEDDGMYVGTGAATGTYTAMTTPEECDIGARQFTGETKAGYDAYDTGFDSNPKTNANMLLGCKADCTVETAGQWRCPLPADIQANAGNSWALNSCTDRCGDGLYDGPIPDTGVGRTGDYPTTRKAEWSQYPISTYPDYDDTGDYSGRMLSEQCDTIETQAGDYTHGCDRLCQRSTDTTTNLGVTVQAWVCTHYFLDLAANLLEHPLFRSHCEWQGPATRRMR